MNRADLNELLLTLHFYSPMGQSSDESSSMDHTRYRVLVVLQDKVHAKFDNDESPLVAKLRMQPRRCLLDVCKRSLVWTSRSEQNNEQKLILAQFSQLNFFFGTPDTGRYSEPPS